MSVRGTGREMEGNHRVSVRGTEREMEGNHRVRGTDRERWKEIIEWV